ncbi:MAG: immunoglobulin domain-containing protein, partial [Limisphaerales bacterium]
MRKPTHTSPRSPSATGRPRRFAIPGSALAATTLALGLAATTPTSHAAVSGQWDFEAGNLTATTGQALEYADGPGGDTSAATAFGTTTSFGIPNIAGAEAKVMRFGTNTIPAGYYLYTPAVPNGGGSQVNQWTLLLDVLYPAVSNGRWRALVETDNGATPDAEFFVNTANAVGIGSYGGTILPDTWHRIALVVDTAANEIRTYIDGKPAVTRNAGGAGAMDGRWALTVGGVATLFADDNGETAGGYVNSIQLHNAALSKGQILALGAPTAAGLPATLPPVPSSVEQWIPAGAFASRTTSIGAVVNPGDTTIADSSISLTLDGAAVASPAITRADGLIRIEKTNPGLTLGQHTLVLAFTDSLAGARSLTNEFTAALYFEDFESVVLGPNKEEGLANENAWTHTPPAGWTIDNSNFVATVIDPDLNPDGDADGYADQDGITEWAGWSFANRDWWVQTAGDQRRSEFSFASGNVAIADPDEWDDSAHVPSLFNSILTTPPIPVTGLSANSITLAFASSWRPEARDDGAPNFPVDDAGQPINNQTALISASFDGGAPIQVLKWDSVSGSPTFHTDTPNESVLVPVANPANAQNMVLTFALLEGANDWWWAIDNIAVSAGAAPPSITTNPASIEVAEGAAATLSVVATGDGVSYQWFKGQGTGKTAVSGATGPSLALATARIEDAGYYSVEVKNTVATLNSSTAKLTVLAKTEGRNVLLSENFDGLALGPNVDEGVAGDAVWTKTAPDGWTIDDTGVPGVGTDQDGVTEWAGWSFAQRTWWAETGGDQQRTGFTKGTGTSAIADSDEWDDVAHAAGNMATYLKTKPIAL